MNKLYDIWFHKLKLSVYDKKRLIDKVTSFKMLYEADMISYAQWGLNRKGIELIEKSKKEIDLYTDILLNCDKESIDIIGYFDKDYPKLLKEIPDPPMLLYSKGQKTLLNQPSIAIVGARKCTENGDYTAQRLAKEFSDQGFIIASGMANGIDAAAQKSALVYGTSIAVVGTGVNICYPKTNLKLYQKLIEKGCVISEYDPFTEAKPYHFPCRNRIISGISYGTVVVEAAMRSGALITAHLAAEYDREVGVVPGQGKMSEGTNALIEDGAHSISCAEDMIKQFPKAVLPDSIKKESNLQKPKLAELERLVYANIGQTPIVIEELEEIVKDKSKLQTILLQLEVKEFIERIPGERYRRRIK